MEWFRLLTPYITLGVLVTTWVLGWLIRRLIADNLRLFADLKSELKEKIDERSTRLENRLDRVERDLEKLELSRLADQKYLYEQFVTKEGYYRTIARTESAIGRIFKQLNQIASGGNRVSS